VWNGCCPITSPWTARLGTGFGSVPMGWLQAYEAFLSQFIARIC